MGASPAKIIERLDASLARRGETVQLLRRIGTAENEFVTITIRARLRGYEAKELVPPVKQTDSAFIFSPSVWNAAVAAAAWPAAGGGEALPRIGDFIRQATGRDRKI